MGREPPNPGPAIRALIAAAVAVAASGVPLSVAAQVRLVAAPPAKVAKPAEPVYEDKLIEGLAPLPSEEEEAARHYDAEGWPRYLRLETRLGRLPFGDGGVSAGASVSGVIETPNHGTLSVDAGYARDEGRGTATLRQRALPMGEGWLVNNELGVMTPLGPQAMREASRVFVPSVVTRGAATEWVDTASKTQWLASTGEPGRMLGYPVSAFHPLAGNLTIAGVQQGFGDWVAAARAARADGVTLSDQPASPADYIDSDAAQVSLRHATATHRVQANFLTSRSSQVNGDRRGLWVDGEWRAGRATHGWGFYRLDKDLTWAGQAMASDIEGAFLRESWREFRWSAEGSLDVLRPATGHEATGVLASANGRWRYSRTLTLGAGGTVRRYNGNAGSGFADARWTHELGTSGVRLDFTDGFGERRRRLALDHGWLLPLGWTLNTTLAGGRESGTDASGTLWDAAITLTAPLTSNLTMSGNATVERRGDGSRASAANVNVAWRLDPNWSLEGNFIHSLGRSRETRLLDPLAPPPDPVFSTTSSNSVFVVLRYEAQAGSRSVPLGGNALSGGGRIEGVVFLDANRNGTQEAGEAGAQGVTVYLDGRYAVRTDSQGRFEFPFVAPGARALTVVNETLPLPWEAGPGSQPRVEVRVRESTRVAIPVTRRGPD